MTLTVTSVGDNPQQPGISAETYIPDQLIAGDLKIVTESATITGSAALARGSVLGRVSKRLAAAPIPTVVGTGNGTMTVLEMKEDAQVGNYVVTCTAAAANGGTFSVVAPDGTSLGSATVGTRFVSSQISFLLNDGSTDFIVGDAFTVVVTAGGTPAVVGTGNGTIGSISLGRFAELGTYVARCTTTATNGGTFTVFSPGGEILGTATVGTAFASDAINFTIADGSTDFALNDYFNIVVAAGVGSYKLATATATDGSNVPAAILADYADASSADVTSGIYLTGEFNANALTFGSGITASIAREALRDRGIFIKTPVSATDPS